MRRWGSAFVVAVLASVLLAGPALAQLTAGESVRGALEREVDGEDEPIEGVQITVSQGDQEIEQVTTDAEGAWAVDVPEPGEYRVELDPGSLPEGAELRNPENNPLTVDVRTNQARTVLFAIGERSGPLQRTGGLRGRLGQLFVDGLKFGLIIAMTAVGLSLIFGTTGLVNFAHGELVASGAIIAWFLNSGTGLGIHLIVAALLAVAGGAALGGGLERGLFQPLRRRGTGLVALLVVTIGLSLLLRYILLYFFGGRARPYSDYTIQRAHDFGLFAVTPKDATVMGLSVLVLLAVGLLLLRTRMGKAIRAVADNRDLAESSGIDVERVILIVWMLGGALAALGGVFQGTVEAVNWNMGFQLLLLMFAGVILGGLGTAFGALAGSVVVGVVTQYSTLYMPTELKSLFALLILILVLLVRPQGLLGQAERVG